MATSPPLNRDDLILRLMLIAELPGGLAIQMDAPRRFDINQPKSEAFSIRETVLAAIEELGK